MALKIVKVQNVCPIDIYCIYLRGVSCIKPLNAGVYCERYGNPTAGRLFILSPSLILLNICLTKPCKLLGESPYQNKTKLG